MSLRDVKGKRGSEVCYPLFFGSLGWDADKGRLVIKWTLPFLNHELSLLKNHYFQNFKSLFFKIFLKKTFDFFRDKNRMNKLLKNNIMSTRLT